MTDPYEGGWESWSKYVLKELERQGNSIISLQKSREEDSKELLVLKVKAGIVGAIAGVIFSALTTLVIKQLWSANP